MVFAVRQGISLREVARRHRCGVATVHLWVRRAGDRPLSEVNWNDRPSLPHKIQRTDRTIEDLVLTIRRELRETSVLGEYSAPAIHGELLSRSIRPIPSVRTIGRIIERRGALDSRRRIRQRPPVAGWYLPEVAERASELDSFDVIEDLMIEGGIHIDVFTAISLHGGLVACWPDRNIPSTKVVSAMSEHWRSCGLPAYAQFDNDARFQGNHRFADSIGRVIRLCLSLVLPPSLPRLGKPGFKLPLKVLMVAGRPKFGSASITSPWSLCNSNLLGTSQPTAVMPMAASSKLPLAGPFRDSGSSTFRPIRTDASSTCGARANKAK